MFRTLCIITILLNYMTFVSSYDPSTCIQCRKSHVCNPPECFCCRDEMPLEKHNIPQMVFFTFDDAVNPQVAAYYKELFDSKRKNPNGCPISMTLFISHSNTVYRLVREFYEKGMEIASHSVTHSHPSAQTFIREARKQRDNLAKKANIPKEEIVGWRSPFLEPLGDTQPAVLKQLGYEYDATLTITKKSNTDKAITPFTLDYGWPYDCKIKSCPSKSHKGFWEVPVVSVKDYLNKYDCVYVDGCNNPPPSENLAFKFLWDNFQRYYKSNRAPMGINMHASWFYYPDRKRAMNRFIKELLKLNDVYIVSVKQVLAWLKNPTPLQQLKNFLPWQCNNGTSVPAKTMKKKIGTNRKPTGINRTHVYQKMAEQRNQWRRQQLQHQRPRLNTYPNQPIPSVQPANTIPPMLPPGLPMGPSPLPPGPPMPPLAPSHPMINFWWQPPPPRVLPPEVQHELEIRRNIELQQLEQQRRENAFRRQRMEQERHIQAEAQRRAQEQQRLQMLRQQQEQKRRQDLLNLQREKERLNALKVKQEQERKLKLEQERKLKLEQERKLKLEKERQLKLEQERKMALLKQKEALAKQNRETSKQTKNDKTVTVQEPNQLNIEYQTHGKTNPAGNDIKLSAYRPQMREIHEQQLIKEKLKLHPSNLIKERNNKEQNPPMTDSILQNNPSSVEKIDKHTIHKETNNVGNVPSPPPFLKAAESQQNDIMKQQNEPFNSLTEATTGSNGSNTKLLDNILNFGPEERLKYLHDLSLGELKSLQAELRRRLANDASTTSPELTTTIANIDPTTKFITERYVVNDIIKEATKLPTTTTTQANMPDNSHVFKSLRQAFSSGQETAKGTNSAQHQPETRVNDVYDSLMQSTSSPLDLATVYNGVTTRLAELTTKTTLTTTTTTTEIPTTTTTTTQPPPTTSTATTTTTSPPTTTTTTTTAATTTTTTQQPTQPYIPAEPTVPLTTRTVRVNELGSKSLWQISDIFDMSNRINGKTTKTLDYKQPLEQKPFMQAFPTKSINLFTVDKYDTRVPNSNFPIKRQNSPADYQAPNEASNQVVKSMQPSPTISKSLFTINNNNGDAYPTMLANKKRGNKKSRVSLSLSDMKPIEIARLTIGSKADRRGQSAYNLFMHSTSEPYAVTAPTKTTRSNTKYLVNKPPLQRLIKPINLFESNFGTNGRKNITNHNIARQHVLSKPKMAQKLASEPIVKPYHNDAEFLSMNRVSGAACSQGVNCYAPDCICKVESTPGNLPANNIPQIVYITIDGSLNFHTYSKIRELFKPSRVNPNGCRIGGTLFVTDAGSSYRIADLLYGKGLELGLSGLSSRPQKTAEELENNIITLTEQITSSTRVSPIAIKGWRSPGFKPIGDPQFSILQNYSLYDSSLVSTRNGRQSMLWPFTLDFGWKEGCGRGPCPTEDHPGVMEVPVIPFIGPGNSTACEYTDGCTRQPQSEKETFDYLMYNFNSHYKSNRAPFAIRLKQIWFHWYYRANMKGLIKFLNKILTYKDVYVTSVNKMLDWVKDPTPLDQLHTFQPWKC